LFHDRSVRIWTVLGGMASVLALIWAIHPIHAASGAASGIGHPGPTASSAAASPTEVPTPTTTGVWIAQLASVPISAGSAQLQQVLAEVRTDIPNAQYLDSSDYASLNPGYWVVYYMGSFGDGDQALHYCAAHGRTNKNQCVGRFLSNDIRDKSYICFPPTGSQAAGCFRSNTTALRSGFGII
jgi:eukaryotic-like serine/threonine-protein kinase